MNLTDKERGDLREEVFSHIREAHVLMFQYNDHLLPGWPQLAGLLKQVGGRLLPSRIGELMDSDKVAIQRNKDAAKAKESAPTEKPISKAKKRGIPVKVLDVEVVEGGIPEASQKNLFIAKARKLGIKADARMSIDTIKAKIAEHSA